MRPTGVPVADLLAAPVIGSPSQWPGTARSPASAGRSPVITIGSRNQALRSSVAGLGRRVTRPLDRAQTAWHMISWQALILGEIVAVYLLGLFHAPTMPVREGAPVAAGRPHAPVPPNLAGALGDPTYLAACVKFMPPETSPRCFLLRASCISLDFPLTVPSNSQPIANTLSNQGCCSVRSNRPRARRRLGGSGANERRGGVRPPVPGVRAAEAGVPGPGLGSGLRRAREGRRRPRLPHGECREERAARGEAAMSHDRLCRRYGQFAAGGNVVGEVGRKAGRNMEVDWSGPTMSLVDPATGVVSKVCLFVACLPFSGRGYAEPALDMRRDTWLRRHVHAFESLGGATPRVVPDSLKTGVTAHPREGEVVLNAAYEDLAARA